MATCLIRFRHHICTPRCNHDQTHRVCAKIGNKDTSFFKFTGQANLERNKLWAHAEKAQPLAHVVPLPTPLTSHRAAPQAYLKGADRANALVMGGKRLYFEAKEAKDAAATGRLLHLAAVALPQGAAPANGWEAEMHIQ